MIVNVTPADARSFVAEHHYSKSAASGVARYGWEINGELVGVTIIDTGNHAMRQGVFGADYYRHVFHHHRLALTPDAPKLTASKFIGASLRQLRVDRPDMWAIVTYADLCQAHHGTIYQATNAVYTGIRAKGNLKFLTQEGRLVPTQSISGTWPERRTEAAARGWQEVRCLGKTRYVYLLGTKAQRRRRPDLLWPVLDYSQIPTVEPIVAA